MEDPSLNLNKGSLLLHMSLDYKVVLGESCDLDKTPPCYIVKEQILCYLLTKYASGNRNANILDQTMPWEEAGTWAQVVFIKQWSGFVIGFI